MRLIVVEDDAAIRRMLLWFLESYGADVDLVEDSEGTLEAIQRGWPDAILLDLSLEHEDGEKVRDAILKKFNRTPPLVVLSGVTDAERRLQSFPGAAFLAKPFRLEELAKALQEFIHPRAMAS
jgi:two-component system phosphate regulon response regulator PhoB